MSLFYLLISVVWITWGDPELERETGHFGEMDGGDYDGMDYGMIMALFLHLLQGMI